MIAQGKHTPQDKAQLQEKRNILRRRIMSWLRLRTIYMPAVSPQENDLNALPESISLKLPSTLPRNVRDALTFRLANVETRMREAQADDALRQLRRLLRVTKGLWQYKFKNVGYGQKANTWARAIIDGFKQKITRCANRYRAARKALLVLDVDGEWQHRLLDLRDQDIRIPGRADGMWC